jgi:hypothetical protein
MNGAETSLGFAGLDSPAFVIRSHLRFPSGKLIFDRSPNHANQFRQRALVGEAGEEGGFL